MKELTTTNTGISVQKKEVLHVLQNEPAFLKEFNDVYDVVLAQIVRSVNHLGWTLPNDDDLIVLVNEITTSIQANHKPLRTDEIATCFAKGIRGEYGEFYGINVVTFDKFITSYLLSDYRASLGKSLPKAELPPPSRELTRQDRIDFAQKAYEKYKITGFYDDLGNIVYEFLFRDGLINFTDEEKDLILGQARTEEYNRLKNPLSVDEARLFNKQIEALMSSNEKIIPRARKISLNKYFGILFNSKSESIPFE